MMIVDSKQVEETGKNSEEIIALLKDIKELLSKQSTSGGGGAAGIVSLESIDAKLIYLPNTSWGTSRSYDPSRIPATIEGTLSTGETITMKMAHSNSTSSTSSYISGSKDCTNLCSITVPQGIVDIHGLAYYKQRIYTSCLGTSTTTPTNWQVTDNVKALEDRDFLASPISMSGYATGNTSITNVPNLNVGYCTALNAAFSKCTALKTVNNIKAVKGITSSMNMAYMFNACTALTKVGVIDTRDCTSPTSTSTSMQNMFYGDTALATIEGLYTDCVYNFTNCFYNCSALTSLPKISLKNVSNVNNIKGMFYGCTGLTSVTFTDVKSSIKSALTVTNLTTDTVPSLEIIIE